VISQYAYFQLIMRLNYYRIINTDKSDIGLQKPHTAILDTKEMQTLNEETEVLLAVYSTDYTTYK
jgi:hypothetical protein